MVDFNGFQSVRFRARRHHLDPGGGIRKPKVVVAWSVGADWRVSGCILGNRAERLSAPGPLI